MITLAGERLELGVRPLGLLAGWVLALPTDECPPARLRADRHGHCVTADRAARRDGVAARP